MEKTSYTLLLSLLATMLFTAHANQITSSESESQEEVIVMESVEATEETAVECDENGENCLEVVIDACANTPDAPKCISETDLGNDTLPVDENTENWSEDATLEQAPAENTESEQ